MSETMPIQCPIESKIYEPACAEETAEFIKTFVSEFDARDPRLEVLLTAGTIYSMTEGESDKTPILFEWSGAAVLRMLDIAEANGDLPREVGEIMRESNPIVDLPVSAESFEALKLRLKAAYDRYCDTEAIKKMAYSMVAFADAVEGDGRTIGVRSAVVYGIGAACLIYDTAVNTHAELQSVEAPDWDSLFE